VKGAITQRELVSNTIQQLKAQQTAPGVPGQVKDAGKKQIAVLEPQMELLNQGIARLEEMGTQYQALNKTARIEFRVLYAPNETETIELAASTLPVDAAPMPDGPPEEGGLRIPPPKEE
jgi:hypothetical protein